MNTPAVLTCAWCGKVKKEISFVIGTFKPREWTMHFGTGKLSCDSPECYRKGCNEAQSQLASHIRSLTPATEVRKPEDRTTIDPHKIPSVVVTFGS